MQEKKVKQTFCSWKNSCLFLLFSFSSSFSLETKNNWIETNSYKFKLEFNTFLIITKIS